MTYEIDCCPNTECQSGAIRLRNPGHPSSPKKITKKYRCKDCGNEFDDPDTRTTDTPPGGGQANKNTDAYKLLQADPDDVLGGGEA